MRGGKQSAAKLSQTGADTFTGEATQGGARTRGGARESTISSFNQSSPPPAATTTRRRCKQQQTRVCISDEDKSFTFSKKFCDVLCKKKKAS